MNHNKFNGFVNFPDGHLDIETPNAIGSRLRERADHIRQVTLVGLAPDIRIGARACELLAHIRFAIAQVAANTSDHDGRLELRRPDRRRRGSRAKYGTTVMVARIHLTMPGFRIVFERDGQELEAEIVPTGEWALRVALVMLAHLEALQDGDRVTVTEVK